MTWAKMMKPVTRYQCFHAGEMRPVLWMVDNSRQQTFRPDRAVGALLWMGGPGNGGLLSVLVDPGQIVVSGEEPVRRWQPLD